MEHQQPDGAQPQPDDRPDILTRIVEVLARQGAASAGHIAEAVDAGYSTTTAKLRALEADGRAEKFRAEDRRTLWRLTPAVALSDDDAAHIGHDGDPNGPAGEQPQLPATHRADEPVPGPDLANPRDPHGEDGQDGADGADGAVTLPAGEEAVTATVAGATARAEDRPPASVDATASGQPVAAQPDRPQSTAGTEPAAQPPGPDPVPGTEAGEDGTVASDLRPGHGPRRRKGALRAAVLAVLQASPDTEFKVSEVCKAINKATEGTDAKKAGAGAVVNALDKLAGEGSVRRTRETPATYQAV